VGEWNMGIAKFKFGLTNILTDEFDKIFQFTSKNIIVSN